MGPHPAVAAIRLAVRRLLTAERPDAVLVACSGGADSLALLDATAFEAAKIDIHVVGATVDHGMQEGSAEHAQRVVGQMAALGADETISSRVQVHAEGLGPEAAARQARYDVLAQMAEHLEQRYPRALVLLGHTRDDQAETVLLGLARGSGGRSIAGMRRDFERYRRPLLDVSRADTVAACEARGIQPWADPHNDDPSYTRVRVRQVVLPTLEAELGPGVARALARTADLLRPDMEYLDDLAEQALALVRRGPDLARAGLDIARLGRQPAPLRTRILRRAAVESGVLDAELSAEHVVLLDRLVTDWHGQDAIPLPGHVRATRAEGSIRFEATSATA